MYRDQPETEHSVIVIPDSMKFFFKSVQYSEMKARQNFLNERRQRTCLTSGTFFSPPK